MPAPQSTDVRKQLLNEFIDDADTCLTRAPNPHPSTQPHGTHDDALLGYSPSAASN